MKTVIRFIIVATLLLGAGLLRAQEPKQVYITLDVSGSMGGDKYVLANYTTQMIVTLCDENDDVHMIVYGKEKILSDEKNPLAAIQCPMASIGFGSRMSGMSQFDDIIGFNNVYQPEEGRQDWLFIIGDGYWSTEEKAYAKDRKKFKETVKGGSLNVCYLQTGEDIKEHSDFTEYVEKLGVVDIGKSSLDAKTIEDGCLHFANKILGFSGASLTIKKNDAKSVKLASELPIKEFILVYQDEVKPGKLPMIIDAYYSEAKLRVRHRGTPTTLPVKSARDEKDLSGSVWRLKAGKPIPAKSEIIVNFDKTVDASKIRIYPLVENITFGTLGLTRVGGGLRQIDSKTYGICEDENTALVRIELNERTQGALPEELLKKTKVTVKANNKDYTAQYKDGGFECIIDLKGKETQYYAECDCPGYFSRVTPIMTIVKGECEPAVPPVKELPTVDFGTMTFHQLVNEPIRGIIQDAESLEQLDPNKFDIDVEIENDFMYEKPQLRVEGNMLLIDVKPKGDWCECLFPTDLNMKVVSTPKQGAFGDKNYMKMVTPVHLRIEKDRPWLSRCFWVLVTMVLLLLFVVYLRALLRKKRFKKNAMLTPRYYSYYGELIDDQGGRKLRKDGFGAWFARWFLPGDEKTTLYFDKPAISSLTLIASESKDVVRILKSCCDWEMMDISGYDPDTDTGKSKTVSLGDMGSIEITMHNGAKEGEVIFTSGSENDGVGYRMFISLLMVASLVTVAVLIWMMLQSL